MCQGDIYNLQFILANLFVITVVGQELYYTLPASPILDSRISHNCRRRTGL